MRVGRILGVLAVLVTEACAAGEDLGALRKPHEGDASVSGGAGGRGATGSSAGSAGTAGSLGGASGVPDASAGSAGSAGTGGPAAGDERALDAPVNSDKDVSTIADARLDAMIAVDSNNGCVASQKVCGGKCVTPEAKYGCALVGCDPCPMPANAYVHCTGMDCDFSCVAGYARSGDACVPGDGGGAGGSGGGGPAKDAGRCDPNTCGGCIPYIQAPCCKPDGTCGCQFPFAPCQ